LIGSIIITIYNNNHYYSRFAKEKVLRVLIGNKNDLENKRVVQEEEGREVGKMKLHTLGRLFNIQFMETSAKNKNNIEELFNSIVKVFLEKNGVLNTKKYEVKLEISQKKNGEKEGFCC